MSAKAIESKVSAMIRDNLSAMGYDLVRVKLMTGGEATLQIMAERLDGMGMTVDDCVAISHAISDRLDTDDTMADKYMLEVSSPGIDRPLVRLKDYERFTGHLAAIELEAAMQPPTEGHKPRKRFKGNIVRIAGNEPDAKIEFSTDAGALQVPMSNIVNAKLVLTDDLIKLHSEQQAVN